MLETNSNEFGVLGTAGGRQFIELWVAAILNMASLAGDMALQRAKRAILGRSGQVFEPESSPRVISAFILRIAGVV